MNFGFQQASCLQNYESVLVTSDFFEGVKFSYTKINKHNKCYFIVKLKSSLKLFLYFAYNYPKSTTSKNFSPLWNPNVPITVQCSRQSFKKGWKFCILLLSCTNFIKILVRILITRTYRSVVSMDNAPNYFSFADVIRLIISNDKQLLCDDLLL